LTHFYRRTLLALGIGCFLAHALVLAGPESQSATRLWSNLLQFVAGIIALLAMMEAGRHSGRAARRIWSWATAALAAYAVGQLLFIYHDTFFQTSVCIPKISDEFFFFWVAPLLAACVIDTVGWPDGFDATVALDFTQLLILALALHLSVFGDASRWQSHGREMEFLKLKVRILRDAVILGCLWARVWLGRSPQMRALFARLGLFFLVYSVGDVTYLYAQAAHGVQPGTWHDLLWSLPRLSAVLAAFTWKPAYAAEAQIPVRRPVLSRRFYVAFYLAPVVVPLVMLVIGFHVLPLAPALWTGLMVTSFAVAASRLLITQFRQERALAERHHSNELLQSIIEGATEAIYLKDREGRYLLINTAGARYLGRSTDEILGKADSELFPVAEAGRIRKSDLEVMNQGEAVSHEEELTFGGVTRTFLSTKNPFRDPLGSVAGVLGISVDITEYRLMQEQLRQAQRMESIGSFSGAIAHDFNNLLTVIKGYSQILSEEVAGHPQIHASIEQINRASDGASALVRQLLAFSRRQILQPRVINLNDIVSNLQKMLHRLIGEDIDIITHLAADLWPVKADPGQIDQVLMNLAANARDAMPRGGKLLLETANLKLQEAHLDMPPGDYVLLKVSDTGIGMDNLTQSRIFEPFFTTKPSGKGTGLGLATTYGIIKQSGGFIWVESEPGKGATFNIYLPPVEEPVTHHGGSTAVVSKLHTHATILLVEDNAQLRLLAATILKQAGYTVIMSNSAEEAEVLAFRYPGPIHMLLTDVVMPGTSGHEVARRVSVQRPETRVLYMSGYADDTVVNHGVLDAGINFLEKPFTPSSLIQRVRRVLEDEAAISAGRQPVDENTSAGR
jgi:PAS domain S-box-containing protein